MADVSVRFWAGAQRAAGRAEERHSAATVAELRAVLVARPELTRIAAVASFLVDGQQTADTGTLRDGSVVDVLPPFAGVEHAQPVASRLPLETEGTPRPSMLVSRWCQMPGSSNDHEHYVSSADWLVVRGRDDLIDEIADQVERRPARPASPTPTRGCRVPDWHVVC